MIAAYAAQTPWCGSLCLIKRKEYLGHLYTSCRVGNIVKNDRQWVAPSLCRSRKPRSCTSNIVITCHIISTRFRCFDSTKQRQAEEIDSTNEQATSLHFSRACPTTTTVCFVGPARVTPAALKLPPSTASALAYSCGIISPNDAALFCVIVSPTPTSTSTSAAICDGSPAISPWEDI
jgi:hypothetical protein